MKQDNINNSIAIINTTLYGETKSVLSRNFRYKKGTNFRNVKGTMNLKFHLKHISHEINFFAFNILLFIVIVVRKECILTIKYQAFELQKKE